MSPGVAYGVVRADARQPGRWIACPPIEAQNARVAKQMASHRHACFQSEIRVYRLDACPTISALRRCRMLVREVKS
jgi:hypothetical protein